MNNKIKILDFVDTFDLEGTMELEDVTYRCDAAYWQDTPSGEPQRVINLWHNDGSGFYEVIINYCSDWIQGD